MADSAGGQVTSGDDEVVEEHPLAMTPPLVPSARAAVAGRSGATGVSGRRRRAPWPPVLPTAIAARKQCWRCDARWGTRCRPRSEVEEARGRGTEGGSELRLQSMATTRSALAF